MENKNNNGPNQIVDANEWNTCNPSEPVRLRIPKSGLAIETTPPLSVPGLLHRTATKYPNKAALMYKNSQNKWEKYTYREYEENVRTCAKAFLKLGLEKHCSVCIMGFNSPKWFFSSLGAMYAGGISTGIYTTNSSAACLHCAECSRANIIVVENDQHLQKILEIKDSLPLLKAIIQYDGEPTEPGVLSWEQLMEIGKKETDEKLNATLNQIAINECCLIVFTSGTVGNPKAVMLNHDNITWNALAIAERLNPESGQERLISYLPLSHIAAQLIDIFIVITIASTTYFADKDALKGSLLKTLQEVRPTYFLGVPRVWEKIYEKMKEIGASSGPLKKLIADWAKYHGLQHNISKGKGNNAATWGYTLAHWMVLKRIRQALGLDYCKCSVSAAAPISPDIKQYFLTIDIPLLEAFGMSEAGGAHTLSLDTAFPINSIGKTLSGMKTKVIYQNGEKSGEVCLYGRHIFMGYLGEPEKTKEVLDDEGWLRSGDVGYIENEFVYITGRIKELLITAGGENIPPVPIEHTVKTELPHLSNVVLIGDKKKFLSLLITLKTLVDSEGRPMDELTTSVKQWLESLGCPAETVTSVIQAGPDEKLLKAIQAGIDRVNALATSNAQKIQKFCILPIDFSLVTGELGPTMKLKRNVIVAKYAEDIEKLYN